MQTVELEIQDVAFGGKGVGRHAGKVVFVPFSIDGENLKVRLIREKKQFAEAELIEVIKASPHRVVPACQYFGACGGCSYQHISYEHQIELKAQQVEQVMRRIGGIPQPPMRKIVPSPLPYGYRNRITVHAQDNVVGFYRRDVHQLINIECCPIALPDVNKQLAKLRATRVRDGHYGLRSQSESRLFAQVNDAVANSMADSIAAMLTGEEKILIDAFCGSGFFSKRLAPQFERVIGIDWDRYAIDAARKGAAPKETYVAGDVAAELNGLLAECDGVETALIVDPPATGLSSTIRSAVLNSAPRRMIYVSCNPSTLARDLADLGRRFEVQSITPFDMFPQTAEIEVVVELRRNQ